MNENKVEGSAKAGLGRIEGAAGNMLDDPKMRAEGGIKQTEGKAQNAVGGAQNAISQVADQAKAAVSKVQDRAQDAYGRASGAAQSLADTIDPFVKDQPYAALGVAAAIGLLAGLLFAGRGPKVVYVRPRD